MSRSTYSKFIPKNTVDTSSYFSFYDVAEKLGIVIGMSSYGFIEQLTGNMRNSIVALVLFLLRPLKVYGQLRKRVTKSWILHPLLDFLAPSA